LSQIATNEVHATERLFQLPTQLPSGTHRFTFKSGPASRWYNLNIFAFARYPWRQEFSLLRRGEILLNQSKISVAGAFLQSTAGVQLSYHLPEHNDWVSLEYVNQQRAFCQPFNQLYLQLKSDGFTGLLRVTLKEKNGEHWVYDDYHCLENRKEFPLTLPWQRFTLPSWRKQGNGIFEADKITCVEISFHPYKTSPGTREILIKSVLLTD
jgi:hypothetical protein